MLPYLELWGRVIPTYGVFAILGCVLGLLLALIRCPAFRLDRDTCAYLYVFGGLGAALGAKLLYLFTVLPQFWRDIHLAGQSGAFLWEQYLSGGMVFYGGLLGAILGALLSARFFGVSLGDYLPILAPSFPLAHSIGRLGCFSVGCCYGIPVSWGLAFSHSPIAPNGVKLMPVQLMEAAAEFCLCLLLIRYAKRKPAPARLLSLYLLLYGLLRFGLEFFRGDALRGLWLGLSTSQWISLLALPIGGLLFFSPDTR